MRVGLVIFPTDKGFQPGVGRDSSSLQLGVFVALGLPPLDRDAALAALAQYAPLVAEFKA